MQFNFKGSLGTPEDSPVPDRGTFSLVVTLYLGLSLGGSLSGAVGVTGWKGLCAGSGSLPADPGQPHLPAPYSEVCALCPSLSDCFFHLFPLLALSCTPPGVCLNFEVHGDHEAFKYKQPNYCPIVVFLLNCSWKRTRRVAFAFLPIAL